MNSNLLPTIQPCISGIGCDDFDGGVTSPAYDEEESSPPPQAPPLPRCIEPEDPQLLSHPPCSAQQEHQQQQQQQPISIPPSPKVVEMETSWGSSSGLVASEAAMLAPPDPQRGRGYPPWGNHNQGSPPLSPETLSPRVVPRQGRTSRRLSGISNGSPSLQVPRVCSGRSYTASQPPSPRTPCSLMQWARMRMSTFLEEDYPPILVGPDGLTRTPSAAALAATCRTDFDDSLDVVQKGGHRQTSHCSLRCLVLVFTGLASVLLLVGLVVLLVEERQFFEHWSGELKGSVEKGFSSLDIDQETAGTQGPAVRLELAQDAAFIAASKLWNFNLSSSDLFEGAVVESFFHRRVGSNIVECPKERHLRGNDLNCVRTQAIDVKLSNGRSVLIVYPDMEYAAAMAVQMAAAASVGQMSNSWYQRHSKVIFVTLGVLTAVILVIGLGSELLVFGPLRHVRELVNRLRNLDFLQEQEIHPGRSGKSFRTGSSKTSQTLDTSRYPGTWKYGHSRIREVRLLQEALQQLEHRMEIICRFIPTTVARNILQGHEHCSRLHVVERNVSIMFSDIADFTNLCESWSKQNFVFVITRYLSVMTQVVEMYDGIVGEILGDGILAFWNTPDDVDDHPSRACSAALAQQKALELLNQQFEVAGLQRLKIRIGIHTGPVLSGTIGCDRRMKFGCMGDPINLASRLEGLCKVYGVNIVCSSSTKEAVVPDMFAFRKLDHVQVKGKTDAVEVYELLEQSGAMEFAALFSHFDSSDSPTSLREVGTGDSTAGTRSARERARQRTHSLNSERFVWAQAYEEALALYQKGEFVDCVTSLEGLLKDHPDDKAATVLLQRAQSMLGPNGSTELSEEQLRTWTGITSLTDK